MKNEQLLAVKAVNNDRFYMPLSWVLNGFQLKEDDVFDSRNTVINVDGGEF